MPVHNTEKHGYGRLQKFFQERQHRHFAYNFHVADDAMQLGVHKMIYHL